MAAQYPGAVVSFSGMIGASTDPLSAPSHVTLEQKQADEIAAIASLGVGPRYKFTSGLWYSSPFAAAVSSSTPGQGDLRLYKVDFPAGTTVDGLGVNVATAGAAGSTTTIVIYGDSSDYPGALQKATSAIASDTTGIKSETFTAEDVSGTRWVGVLPLVATAPAYSAITSGMYSVAGSTITSANVVWTGYQQTGQTSAPANFTATRTPVNGVARVFLRIG